MPTQATCTAPVNIAVVKYWGKRDTSLILPTNSSLSVTLSQDHLRSLTSVALVDESGPDRLWLNGKEDQITDRISTCLAELRSYRKRIEEKDASLPHYSAKKLHIASENNFPTAAGLASSASGLSALIATVSEAFELLKNGYTTSELSRIARQGSGSACRSMFGGFVAWEMGSKDDGSDSLAVEVAPREHWPEMQALVLVVSDAKKGTSSTSGMQRTVQTSELLEHRISTVVPKRMGVISKAILNKDFDSFAIETMADSNQFHAVCLDTQPPIFYLNDTSRNIIQLVSEINRVSRLNEGRYKAAYTYDAGPNAVIYALRDDVPHILSILFRYFNKDAIQFENPFGLPDSVRSLPENFNENVVPPFADGSISRIIHTEIGDGPRVLPEDQSLLDSNGLPK